MLIQETPSISMENARKIIRKSIHTFLQHYQYFTSIPTFIVLPFSMSLLISQSLIPSSFTLLPTISGRLISLLNAAWFPHFDPFFSLVALKLSQTISTFILTLPFSISFLLLSKALIFHYFQNKKNSSFLSLYHTLVTTHLSNSLLIFAVNSTCFSLFFLAFNFVQDFNFQTSNSVFFFTILAVVIYSIVLGNAIVVCNLSLASSALEPEKSSGFMAILRACVTIKGKTTTALALAVPINLGMAAIEALFHYRIVKTQDTHLWLRAIEGVFIAYLYSILLVLDVIMSCFFYQSCVNDTFRHDDIDGDLEVEDLWYYDTVDMEKLKGLEEFFQGRTV